MLTEHTEFSGDANADLPDDGTSTAIHDLSVKPLTPQESAVDDAGEPEESVFNIRIVLPQHPWQSEIVVSTQEQIQDLRQSIMENPHMLQYSCFHLQYKKERLNDFTELSQIDGIGPDSQLTLIEDPYTEKEARTHLIRIREIIAAVTERTDSLYGIAAGSSLHDSVLGLFETTDGQSAAAGSQPDLPQAKSTKSVKSSDDPHDSRSSLRGFDYCFEDKPNLDSLSAVPTIDTYPQTVKGLTLSPWHPPPPHFRQQGHLLYLQLTSLEGETFHITSHVSGFYVNRSTNSRFDPSSRSASKNVHAHSLFNLISDLSPRFDEAFRDLVESNSKHDPLVNFQLTQAIPATPWVVSSAAPSLIQHKPDYARSQMLLLMNGLEGNETMRDWNEEMQSTLELPRNTVQERIFRERLISKIYAEFTDAATRGAMLVARGEIASLNPTEGPNAQIFVYNNIFYSFGADGVSMFEAEGGDEAARVAVGKDVMGVRSVTQLDIPGLATTGTIIVDYLGKRIVAQTIVPGIFKQREPNEHQVDYGGIDGRDAVANNETFVPTFSKISKALRIKPHPVWDKDHKRHFLESSVETKGLLGTDGRKYILDLYRLTPLDISWLEASACPQASATSDQHFQPYPHRMAGLRPELIESYWRLKFNAWVKEQIRVKSNAEVDRGEQGADKDEDERMPVKADGDLQENKTSTDGASQSLDSLDVSAFQLAFNPDVFCGQKPQSGDDQAEWTRDEEAVRDVCRHLHEVVFADLLKDIHEGESGFPMDGVSLCRTLHRRGINVRYLGKLARLCEQDGKGEALRDLAVQEMIARAFKHLVNNHLKDLPPIFAPSCIAHLLNCLLGSGLNTRPIATVDESHRRLYSECKLAFMDEQPATFQDDIERQVQTRYRYALPERWVQRIRPVQLLRSIALKLGVQVISKDFHFDHPTRESGHSPLHNGEMAEDRPKMNGHSAEQGPHNAVQKKKKRAASSARNNGKVNGDVEPKPAEKLTFHPDDIVNIFPVIKNSCPKSTLAEEALEAGKISMMQGQKEIGQELLLRSLTLHEQIYGVLHPQVARVYHQLATLYFQLDEKAAAIELAHKAVIIFERTQGLDSSETVLSYLNLALFEHGNKNSKVALQCIFHALELWKIIYGPDHPDAMTTLNNAAVMFQQLHMYQESRQWFEKSLSLSETSSGRDSVQTATLLFQLAQALVLDGDHKASVNRMREAYSIFLAKLGPEDVNTKESEKWLEQLTSNAVSVAKHAKDVQIRRIRQALLSSAANPAASIPSSSSSNSTTNGTNHPTRTTPSARHDRLTSTAVAATTANPSSSSSSPPTSKLDSRSIDDLMKFIEGNGSGTMSKKTKSSYEKTSSKTHPRRRAGTMTGP